MLKLISGILCVIHEKIAFLFLNKLFETHV